jgi:O-antigen/teichoic acid export membrane protein
MNRSKYLFKNIGILTISNFASKILVFLLVPLYTSVLSTEEYGTYDIVFSTIQLLFPILTLNISDAVMRYSMDKTKNIDDVAAIGLRILLEGTIPVVIFFIGCWYWKWIKPIRGYELYILLYFVFYFLYQFLIQLAKGLEKVVDMGVAGVISTIFLVGGNVLLLLVIPLGLKGFYIANILSQATPAIYLGIRINILKYPILKNCDKSLRKEMLIYCLPLIVTVIGWWVNNAADKYTVAFMCGASANGLLSVSYKIPSIISVIQSIFIQAWQISAIKEYGNNDTSDFYGKAFILLNVLMAALCSWLIILTRPIGHIMYSKDFYNAWEYVPFLLISSVLNSAAGFLGPILSAKKDSKAMALSALYGSGTNVILNIIFTYFIGVQGACIATLISSAVQYASRKKYVRKEISITRYGIVLITWGLLCIQAVFEIYTRWIWVQVLLMLLMFILNRREVKELFKTVRNII